MKKNSVSSAPLPTPTDSFPQGGEIIKAQLKEFTFETQREFHYIDMIGDFVNENLCNFRDIWPWLGAYTKDRAWHPNLNQHLEFIGIAHYTVLKSFCYISSNKESVKINDPDQKYKNILYHYGIINECISKIHYHILSFQTLIGEFPDGHSVHMLEKTYKLPRGKTEEEMIDKVRQYYTTRYHLIESFINFRTFTQPIRNMFTHYPTIDVFYINNKELVVRPEYMQRNSLTIQSINKIRPTHLIDPIILMKDMYTRATNMINNIWEIFLEEIQLINNSPNFSEKIYTDIPE